jgi:hypothetical protein
VAGAGASFEDCGTFAMFIGGDVNLYTDTAKGVAVFTRATYQFDDRDEGKEKQGISAFLMMKRDFTSWLYGAVGGGLAYNFKSGDDQQAAGVKIELGTAPWGTVAFILGIEYQPDAGENAEDVKFIYGGINLLP